MLASSDHVLFHAHSAQLLAVSENAFDSLFGARAEADVDNESPIIMIQQTSSVFDVVLHTIYNIPNTTDAGPTLTSLLEAVSALKMYGVPLNEFIAPSTLLFDHIVSKMLRGPLEVYVVAAENNLEALAVAASRHLHSVYLADISNETTMRMGPIYVLRLVQLLYIRNRYLRSLLFEMPRPHPYRWDCGSEARKDLERAWVLASTSVIWDEKAGMWSL